MYGTKGFNMYPCDSHVTSIRIIVVIYYKSHIFENLMYKTYVYMYSRSMCMHEFIQETSTLFHQFAMLYFSLSDML